MSRLIAFWSPSGTGASTLLLNTASALGARRIRTVAADLNLTTPSLALYADLLPHEQPQQVCLSRLLPVLEEEWLRPEQVVRALLPAQGFLVMPGVLDLLAASRLTEGHINRLLQAVSARTDLLLADLPPALDSVACLPVLEQADLICLVAAPSIASRFHTRRAILPLQGMGMCQKMILVLNHSSYSGAERQSCQDIGLPVSIMVGHLQAMDGLVEAGRIAYGTQGIHLGLPRFRSAIDQLVRILVQGKADHTSHPPADAGSTSVRGQADGGGRL